MKSRVIDNQVQKEISRNSFLLEEYQHFFSKKHAIPYEVTFWSERSGVLQLFVHHQQFEIKEISISKEGTVPYFDYCISFTNALLKSSCSVIQIVNILSQIERNGGYKFSIASRDDFFSFEKVIAACMNRTILELEKITGKSNNLL